MSSCATCRAKTLRGDQCKRKVCKWAPFCHAHSPLEVKATNQYGSAIYATRDIPNNTIVASYKTGTRPVSGNTRGTYVWCPNKNAAICYDASNKKKSIVGNFNTGGRKNNARIVAPSGSVKTKRRVKQGEQIFVPYGPGHRVRGK